MSGRREGDSDTPLSLVERVQRARAIAAERCKTDRNGKLAPTPWPKIGERHGISERQARRIYEDFRRSRDDQEDPLAVVDEAIMLREAARDHLSLLAVQADSSSAQVGAVRSMIEMDNHRLELLQAAGRLPRSFTRFRTDVEHMEIVRRVCDVVERAGVDLSVWEEIQAIARSMLDPLAVAAHDRERAADH